MTNVDEDEDKDNDTCNEKDTDLKNTKVLLVVLGRIRT